MNKTLNKILIVEDEKPKSDNIEKFLLSQFFNISISFSLSVRSGIFHLKDNNPDLILLDMSLPTYDVSTKESGGRPQESGGIEILRYMDKLEINCPVIVVTGFEAFKENDKGIDLEQMREKLKKEHKTNYLGLVSYNSIYDEWKDNLTNLIKENFRINNENINC